MVLLPKSLLAFALAGLALAAPAVAATLSVVNLRNPRAFVQDNGIGLPEQPTLFSTRAARDQNVNNPGRVGDDIFIRNAAGATLTSASLLWGASGTTYAWSLGYDGSAVTFSLGGSTISSTVASGTWNIVSFFLRANDLTRFASSTVTVTTAGANGKALTVPLTFSTTNSTFTSLTYALNGVQTISNLSGTLKFDYMLRANAKQSPGDALSFDITGSQVTPVPLPGSALLLLGALAGLGAIRRGRLAI